MISGRGFPLKWVQIHSVEGRLHETTYIGSNFSRNNKKPD